MRWNWITGIQLPIPLRPMITLYRIHGLDAANDMVRGIVKYLGSHDSFDEGKKKWLLAIESNKNYPHAIWWEKDGEGILQRDHS